MQGPTLDGYSAHPAALDACTHFGALYDTDPVTRGGLSEYARVPVALAALVAELAPQVHALFCFPCYAAASLQKKTKQSRCAANAARNSLLVELHLQGLLSHAMCTSNAGPLGTDRLSSFLLLGASGVPATRLHGLTSRLLRSKPTKHSNAVTQSRHSGLLFEQQWHAAQPVVGSVDGNSLENRAHVRRLRLSIRVRSRMGLTSVLLQSRAGKEAALVCAAVLQKVQAGSLNPAWVTRAAQLAGTFARLVFHCT